MFACHCCHLLSLYMSIDRFYLRLRIRVFLSSALLRRKLRNHNQRWNFATHVFHVSFSCVLAFANDCMMMLSHFLMVPRMTSPPLHSHLQCYLRLSAFHIFAFVCALLRSCQQLHIGNPFLVIFSFLFCIVAFAQHPDPKSPDVARMGGRGKGSRSSRRVAGGPAAQTRQSILLIHCHKIALSVFCIVSAHRCCFIGIQLGIFVM